MLNFLIASNDFYFEWELQLIEWIQSWLGSIGSSIASIISIFGETLIMVAVMGYMYWCKNKKIGKEIAVTFFLNQNLVNMSKNIFIRTRPYMVDENIQCLKKIDGSADIMDIKAQGYSFPSGHSANASSVYSTLAYNIKKKWLTIICIILILLVGISRFCLGVHFPTDVLAGWGIGLFCMIVTNLLFRYIKKEWIIFLIYIVISIPGFFCKSNDYFTSMGMMIGAFSGQLFEDKFVHFENTDSLLESIVRTALGVGIFFGLNTLLKLPFSDEWLDSGSYLSLIVRTIRYIIVLFTVCGIYPMVFKYIHKFKIFNKENKSK